jgi:hypothetical protein
VPQNLPYGLDVWAPKKGLNIEWDDKGNVTLVSLRPGAWETELITLAQTAMNGIYVISPYKHHGMWVFDDARVGLLQEPFVAGADTWIDRVVADIPNAEKGFTLIFSSTPFPGHQFRLDWRREEGGGNWYYSADLDMEGWLCPALFRYFSDAPASLYAQVRARV